jgi:hypothetical protein
VGRPSNETVQQKKNRERVDTCITGELGKEWGSFYYEITHPV